MINVGVICLAMRGLLDNRNGFDSAIVFVSNNTVLMSVGCKVDCSVDILARRREMRSVYFYV
jgi:hypothetical protein